ncbi:MAG TPA: hypothetical protein DIS90_00910 [Cytophagales bacterium]|nr:hypothetical protein [Cytophagales bacterium]
MKILFIIILALFSFGSAFAQKKIKSKKLTKIESADMTREQKLVHESQRKAKKNKPVSMQKKIRLEKKQIKKSKRTKAPKPKKRKN